MPTLIGIALKHLLARKRQSLVSLLGIVLGVAFFLAISSLMQGSEEDFIRRLVDNSPHITVLDEFRNPRKQPLEHIYQRGALEIRSVKPLTESRGIRGYKQILADLQRREGFNVSPTQKGQAIVSFAGRDVSITLNGMIPEEITAVTTIANYMVAGTIEELIANPDGIIIGAELARTLSISLGDNLTVASPSGEVRAFKTVGFFRVGRADFDKTQTFVAIKRAQALLKRSQRINNILIKLADPYQARTVAAQLEAQIQYKSISWQEASEDIMNTLTIRNIIMYTVVSAVLIVAAFGIYNVISTVVLEKQRDIAILKSMGFYASDISRIFLFQGTVLGFCGALLGLPFGSGLMLMLMQIRFTPPGGTTEIQMPIDWGWEQFVIAATFAMVAAVLAAYLPARKAASVEPVAILRGIQ